METFGLFWSVKYLSFEQKLPIRTAHHIFLESRHPEFTKNPYYVLSPKGSQKKVSANRLIPVRRGVYIHYFNPPTFGCPLFSANYPNPYVRVNKIVNKCTADYRLSYFYGLLRVESFLNFLLNQYILEWLRKSFKFIVLRLLQVHLWIKKLNLFIFILTLYQNSPSGFYHYPSSRKELRIPPKQCFLKIVSICHKIKL